MGLLDDIVMVETKEAQLRRETCAAFSRGRWELEMREKSYGHEAISRCCREDVDEQRMRIVGWMAVGSGSGGVDVAG
jgi:hypothetical protein